MLRAAGYTQIDRRTKALDGTALREALDGVRLLGIRSRTQIKAEVIDGIRSLVAIGCFSVGTNQVDLAACRTMGIPVFNAPFSNTRSVAELTMAEIVMLMRRIFPKSVSAHAGGWDKSAVGSNEVRGKTLGIVGYGHIGTQLGVLAEAMGMRVIYYDHTDKLRHGNVEPADSLDELLARPTCDAARAGDAGHAGMIGAREIAPHEAGRDPHQQRARHGRRPGGAGRRPARQALSRRGHRRVPGRAVVQRREVREPLQGLDNVILTPHVGGSTEEAQERIGAEVARKFVEYSDVGSTTGAVNFPQVQLPPRPAGTRFIQVQRNLPGELGRLNEVFARRKVNIAAQHYQTDGELGYVVLDADGKVADAEAIVKEIRGLSGTIRARMLYRRT